MKKTVVLGATPNPERYAYLAVMKLHRYGHEVVPVGPRAGDITGIPIQVGQPPLEGVDTITLYLRAENQVPYYDYIFSLKPKRIIFNPGTENRDLTRMALEKGVEPVEGCTLVMLSTRQY
jgi:predicted CoA-binding protein